MDALKVTAMDVGDVRLVEAEKCTGSCNCAVAGKIAANIKSRERKNLLVMGLDVVSLQKYKIVVKGVEKGLVQS